MAVKNVLSYLILIFLCFGCERHSRHVVLADQLIDKIADQLQKEKELRMIGNGGQMMGDVQLIRIEFQYFHLVDLQDARKLLIYTIQTFLKNINGDQKIRPYLHTYPFSTNNIEVKIWIHQPNGNYPSEGDIQCSSLGNNVLLYRIVEPSEFAPMPILHEETYEEALKALRKSS